MNFSGGLFCWKKQSQKIRPKNSGPKFGRPKFVSQNSGLNSGFWRRKIPCADFVPDDFGCFGHGLITKHDILLAVLCVKDWETEFYTPPVLGGAALLPFSAPVYKNQGP